MGWTASGHVLYVDNDNNLYLFYFTIIIVQTAHFAKTRHVDDKLINE